MNEGLGRLIPNVFGGDAIAKDPADPASLDGCRHEQLEPHICPYQDDVNNDSDYRCTCCEACQQQCADDI